MANTIWIFMYENMGVRRIFYIFHVICAAVVSIQLLLHDQTVQDDPE